MNNVKVRTTKGQNVLNFVAWDERKQLQVSMPSFAEHQEVLNTLVPFRNESISMLPDYSAYLKNILVLDDAVLLPALISFKEYLEEVQVVLGTLDTWTAVSVEAKEFFKDLFSNFRTPKDCSQMPYFEDKFNCAAPESMTIEDSFSIKANDVKSRERLKSFIAYARSLT